MPPGILNDCNNMKIRIIGSNLDDVLVLMSVENKIVIMVMMMRMRQAKMHR